MSTHKSLGVGALFFLLAIFNALASPAVATFLPGPAVAGNPL